MTTRIAAFLVILDDDYREDDTIRLREGDETLYPTGADAIRWAIQMIKGVATVEPVPADFNLAIATARVRSELAVKLAAVLDPRQ